MINIAQYKIGTGYAPFVIAEMSGNHNKSLERALEIVEAVAKTGAQALKIQTYTPESMTLDLAEREFNVTDRSSPWFGDSLHSLYKSAYTPWEWHSSIFARARDLGLIVFSTPFDDTSVDFLETLDVPCYKIASFENTDLPLIRRVAATGKPLIISTGMASVSEMGDAVRAARESGCKDLVLLKCTSTYPANPTHSNLLTIPHMKDLFGCEVGLSDHTMGIGTAIASVAVGASVIEKHFTLRRADGGVDSAFSLEPDEMRQLVIEAERAWQSLGTVSYESTEAEKRSLIFRRTLYITKDLKIGDMLTKENIRAIRPGLGLPIKYLDIVLGRRVVSDVVRGTALSWSVLT